MMGSKGTVGGDECDAFSRRSRRLIRWGKGQVQKIKRGYARRMRRSGRQGAKLEAHIDG